MENPFDKYATYNNPSIVKFNLKLLKGNFYAETSTSSDAQINLKMLVDTYIPFGTNTIESLDFNLYAINNRSDTPSKTFNLNPIVGVKVNVNELISDDKLKIRSENGVYKLDYIFKFTSPFVGTNFDLLGVNIVINRQSLRDDSPVKKENIYTTVIPIYYLDSDINGK